MFAITTATRNTSPARTERTACTPDLAASISTMNFISDVSADASATSVESTEGLAPTGGVGTSLTAWRGASGSPPAISPPSSATVVGSTPPTGVTGCAAPASVALAVARAPGDDVLAAGGLLVATSFPAGVGVAAASSSSALQAVISAAPHASERAAYLSPFGIITIAGVIAPRYSTVSVALRQGITGSTPPQLPSCCMSESNHCASLSWKARATLPEAIAWN